VIIEKFDSLGIVSQHDSRDPFGDITKRSRDVARAAPQIVDSGNRQLGTVVAKRHGFVSQHTNFVFAERPMYCKVESRIATDSKGISNRIVVISQHGKHAERGPQLPQQLGYRFHETVTLVYEITRQRDQIRLATLSQFDAVSDVVWVKPLFEMEIAELNYS